MSHLNKFSNKAAYEAGLGGMDYPAVSLIGATGEVLYNKTRPIAWGSYLHADGTIDNTPSANVIGICFIPSSHYGKARFMTVKPQSASNLQWYSGQSGTDPYVPATGYSHKYAGMDLMADPQDTTVKLYDMSDDQTYCMLPTDRKHGAYDDGVIDITVPSGWDDKAIYWVNDDDDTDRYPQSPFLADGSLNPNFAMAWPNFLSDMDGEANTAAILAAGANNHPAAKACHDFNPGCGNWYLPTIGEMAYVMARWGALNDKLEELEDAGCDVDYLPGDAVYWTSCVYDVTNSFLCDMDNGRIDYLLSGNKYHGNSVLRVSAF